MRVCKLADAEIRPAGASGVEYGKEYEHEEQHLRHQALQMGGPVGLR